MEHFPRHTVADSQWKKKTQNKTNQSQIWKNDGASIAAPEETNNILAKLSQHLQISISRNARRRCQVHTSGSSHVHGVNINFEQHSVRFACISFCAPRLRSQPKSCPGAGEERITPVFITKTLCNANRQRSQHSPL